MKKRYKILLILGGILAFLIVVIYSGILSAGSYPYSENYIFQTDSGRLVNSIKEFKRNYPSYNVPRQVGLVDTSDENKIFHNNWIYDAQKNEIIFFIIESNFGNKKSSTLRLISINYGLSLGNWKTVNDDIGRTENLDIKKQFKIQLLDKLGLPYSDDGNGMFVFWK